MLSIGSVWMKWLETFLTHFFHLGGSTATQFSCCIWPPSCLQPVISVVKPYPLSSKTPRLADVFQMKCHCMLPIIIKVSISYAHMHVCFYKQIPYVTGSSVLNLKYK